MIPDDVPDTVLAAFAVTGPVLRSEQLGGGHIHRTWRVTTLHDDVVVQRVNRHVFRDLDACESNLARVDEHFSNRDADMSAPAVPLARRTVDGRIHAIELDKTAWRCSEWLHGTVAVDTIAEPDQAWRAAKAFAAYGSWLSHLRADDLVETIPGFHDFAGRARAFDAAIRADRVGRAQTCRDVIAAAVAAIADHDIRRPLPPELLGPAHNDAKVANLRFDASTGAVACVLDLDTTGPGSPLFDLGELLRTGATDASEDAEPGDQHVDHDRARAIVAGFVEASPALRTAAGQALVGSAGPRMTLENAIRFLGDHLDGDRYFAVDYPGHNLARARNHLRLAELLGEFGRSLPSTG